MKLKKIFVTLGLSLAVGMGVSAGLCAASSEAKETNAVTSTTVYCALDVDSIVTDLSISNLVVKCNVNYKGDGDDWDAHTMSDLGDGTSYPGKRVYTVTFDDKYNGLGCIQFQVLDGDTWKVQDQVFGTKDWKSPSVYNGKLCELSWNNPTLSGNSWVDYTPTVSKWTVTKMAVEFINGVAQEPADWNLGSDEVYDGVSHSVPGTTYKNLEHFVGWYADASCSTAYNGTASVSSNITIYAKYERLTLDSYFYWCDKDSGDISDGYVYFWNEYQTGYNEISIKSCQVSVISLEGQGNIYRIPVPSAGNISCLLHSSSDNVKSFDINSIQRGAVYYTYFSHESEGKYYYNFSTVSDAGHAADFLYEFEAYRNAVSASSGILDYSICGISPSNAAYLYGKYELLSPEVKGYVDRSSTITYVGKYDGVNAPKESQFYFSAIMDEIYTIALKDNTFAANHLSSRFSPIFDGTDNSALVIAVTAFAAILASGGFFFLRRRKEN